MSNVPKRSDQRRRRNKESRVVKVSAAGPVKVPPAPKGVHPEARAWYLSLADSPQSRFYEPSDWQTAIVATRLLDDYLQNGRVSAVTEWRRQCASLLVTEVDRRRGRVEVHRDRAARAGSADPGVAAVADIKKRLGVAN